MVNFLIRYVSKVFFIGNKCSLKCSLIEQDPPRIVGLVLIRTATPKLIFNLLLDRPAIDFGTRYDALSS